MQLLLASAVPTGALHWATPPGVGAAVAAAAMGPSPALPAVADVVTPSVADTLGMIDCLAGRFG